MSFDISHPPPGSNTSLDQLKLAVTAGQLEVECVQHNCNERALSVVLLLQSNRTEKSVMFHLTKR